MTYAEAMEQLDIAIRNVITAGLNESETPNPDQYWCQHWVLVTGIESSATSAVKVFQPVSQSHYATEGLMSCADYAAELATE